MPHVGHPTQIIAAEVPEPAVSRFAQAVRAAIAAYEKSGRMLDTALAYAAHGIPVFPLSVNKTPIPQRDRDADGKPIPGTGSFKKATCDPIQIHAWWRRNQYLIGMPTGRSSGVWCVDVDTSEDHADGVAEWHRITAARAPIVTRQHRSATDGPHLFFVWDEEMPLGCSSGALPCGIEVKGQGGYVVLPPSRRKGRAYTVRDDIDPVLAPAWLTDLIRQGRAFSDKPFIGQITADQEELADALTWIPNEDLDWPDWKAMGLRIFAATEGKGFGLFDLWSQKSNKYEYDQTQRAWGEIVASPPTRTGAEVIFRMARSYGWTQWLHGYSPSYPRRGEEDLTAARRTLSEHVNAFWQRAEQWFADIPEKDDLVPPAEALRVDTGVGKTEAVISSFAALRASLPAPPTQLTSDATGHGEMTTRPLIYTVDRHKLGAAIEARFAALGVRAKAFRGRGAEDPEAPGQAMCRNPAAVALAVRTLADVDQTCCRKGKIRCALFDQCGYQRQKRGEPPDVWVMAHDSLFHTQKAFGKPAAVIIDEAMWQKGIRGIEREENEIEWTVPLASLIANKPYEVTGLAGMRTYERDRLGRALDRQSANGGVQRGYLEQFGSFTCSQAISIEWKLVAELVAKLGLYPGMSEAKLRRLANDRDTIDAIAHSRKVIRLWETVRELISKPETAVSGRLTLKQRNGQRVVEWKGVAEISKQFRVPTLLIDATLPALPLLQVYHPQVQIVADIKVATPPSVHVRQVLGSPTSANKLNSKEHLREIQLHIVRRWRETGRQPSLVICQQKVEGWLRANGLPGNIEIAHFNDIAGDDRFGHVRLLILIGRTAPGPQAMESLAGGLTGTQPALVKVGRDGFSWYPPVKQGIALRDGFGIATMGDQHPDRIVEAIRWQVHETQLMQARGRAREVNRTAAGALLIEQLFDTCLPLPVDEVTRWRTPSWLLATAVMGVMRTSPGDLVKLWPQLWPNTKAADRTLKRGVPELLGFEPVEYQLAGSSMNRRAGFFDRTLIPDPRAWLAERLGALTPL
jgi:hypothetical protein